MNSLPLISIVTPSFNQARFLEETICSVLNQGYPRLEYLIMDGGSTDGSVEIIRKYADRLAHWSSGPDAGQAEAINHGWRLATGEVIGWLNSDDRLRPGALAEVGRAFAAHPAAAAIVGGGANIDERGRPMGFKPPRRLGLTKVLLLNTFHQPSVFLSRGVLETAGWLDAGLRLVFDWEYWLRLYLNYDETAFHYLDVPLADNRIWPATKTALSKMQSSADEQRRVVDRVFADPALPPELRPLHQRAVAETYWRQGHLQREAGQPRAGLHSIRRARQLAPGVFPGGWAWGFQFWLQTYIRYPFWLIPGWALGKARRWLQKIAGGRHTG